MDFALQRSSWAAAASLLGMGTGGLFLDSPAHAGCCRGVKVGPQTASTQLQGGEPDGADEAGGGLLLLGTLAVGEDQTLCMAARSVVYREWDVGRDGFGPPVEARWEGEDVEI